MKHTDPLCDVSLYLRGDSLDPQVISAALGVPATLGQKLGDSLSSKSNARARNGAWVLKAQSNSIHLRDHLDEMFGLLKQFNRSLRTLEGVEYAFLDVFMATEDESGQTMAICLNEERVLELARLGLALEVTLS